MKKLLKIIRKADLTYNMINKNDKIAIGISGGKDSILLTYILKQYQTNKDKDFDILGIMIDNGFRNNSDNILQIKNYFKKIGVRIEIIKTKIFEEFFEKRDVKYKCSFCAKIRRGVLNNYAKKFGCNKVALGHHLDDAVSTLFMSMFYEGRIHCFTPVTYMSRTDIHIIRPMIYLTEKQVIKYKNRFDLPVIKNLCPESGNTKRNYFDILNKKFTKDIPGFKKRILRCLENKKELELWK
jgi:tRNA(Ile)-lysidine synthase TilS/MesJ